MAALLANDSGYGGPCAVSEAGVQFADSRQPLANATSTRPCESMCMSLKSSRFLHGFDPPPVQMQPSCTGSPGVVSTVVQVFPLSYVVAT